MRKWREFEGKPSCMAPNLNWINAAWGNSCGGTSAEVEAWKCNFPDFLEIITDTQTDRPVDTGAITGFE